MNLNVFEFFPLRFVSSFRPLWSEKMLDMISIFLNLLRLVLCPIMWSIFENVPCAFEKKVYLASWTCKVLYITFIAFYLCVFPFYNILIDSLLGIPIHFWLCGIQNPNYNCVAVYIFHEVLQDFSYIFGYSILCTYMLIIFISSWWSLPLCIMKCPSVSLFRADFWKSILSEISIGTLAFYSSPFAWNIFSQPFTFSMCRSFVLR